MRDIVDDRVNEVWVYYGIIDNTKNLTEDSNYSNLYIASNVNDQSQVQNRDVRKNYKAVGFWTGQQRLN